MGRPKSNRNDITVKLDADTARMAKAVAAFRDITLVEYLTSIVKPVVEADIAKHFKENIPGTKK
jgi:hypothetical protein